MCTSITKTKKTKNCIPYTNISFIILIQFGIFSTFTFPCLQHLVYCPEILMRKILTLLFLSPCLQHCLVYCPEILMRNILIVLFLSPCLQHLVYHLDEQYIDPTFTFNFPRLQHLVYCPEILIRNILALLLFSFSFVYSMGYTVMRSWWAIFWPYFHFPLFTAFGILSTILTLLSLSLPSFTAFGVLSWDLDEQ